MGPHLQPEDKEHRGQVVPITSVSLFINQT